MPISMAWPRALHKVRPRAPFTALTARPHTLRTTALTAPSTARTGPAPHTARPRSTALTAHPAARLWLEQDFPDDTAAVKFGECVCGLG